MQVHIDADRTGVIEVVIGREVEECLVSLYPAGP